MKCDVAVIGGGIIGLSTAYHLLKKHPGLKVKVLEKEHEIAQHQTGNNSGVIHSGIYYKPGSLKAQNCISGYHKLLNFCDQHNIKYDLCGKIIVATSDEELPRLRGLYDRGRENGLEDLKVLNRDEMREIEPYVEGKQAILVPQTGIVDYKEVCKKLAEDIEALGAEIHLNTEVRSIDRKDGEVQLITNKNFVEARFLINCAGLYSDKVAGMQVEDLDVRIIPFRGEYYELTQEASHMVKNLIYPVPDPAFPFLGVHFTRMIGGGIEAGPNAVFAFRKEGYHRTDFDAGEFFQSLSWPGFRKVAAKYWKTGLGEMYRSFSKKAFTKALQGSDT